MADVPQTLPVEFGQEYRVKLGKSFTFPKENAFHTIKYDFKPLSLDQGQPGKLRVSEGDEVAVSLPMVQAESSAEGAQVYFKGSRKACTKECILIINGKTGEATLEKISDTVQLKVVRDGTERARSTKLLRDHSVSPNPAQQQQKQVAPLPPPPPAKGQVTSHTTPSSTPQPFERRTPTPQSVPPKAPKKVKSAPKSPHQATNKRKLDATAAPNMAGPTAAVASTPAHLSMPQSLPSLTVQAPTPITPSPVPPFAASGQGIPTKKIKQGSSSGSDSSSSSSGSSSSEGDSDSDALMSELQGQVAGVPMEVNQPLGHVASIQSGIMSGGLLVANATNGQAPGPPAITTTSQPPTTLQQVPPTALQQVPPATLQQGPPTAPPATMGGQRVGQFAGKMPTPQDNAVIGIMSSESGNSSSSNSGSSSSDSSDSSDENDNEVANAFGFPPAPPPQRTISQLRTDLELSESGSDSEP